LPLIVSQTKEVDQYSIMICCIGDKQNSSVEIYYASKAASYSNKSCIDVICLVSSTYRKHTINNHFLILKLIYQYVWYIELIALADITPELSNAIHNHLLLVFVFLYICLVFC
jgi:hypothetical protein